MGKPRAIIFGASGLVGQYAMRRFEETYQGGVYTVWAEAEGSHSSHSYRRTTQTAFHLFARIRI